MYGSITDLINRLQTRDTKPTVTTRCRSTQLNDSRLDPATSQQVIQKGREAVRKEKHIIQKEVKIPQRLTGTAWDASDELELEDVAAADGVNMILDTLAEAFQGEYDVDGSHTAYALQAKEALIEQEEDIDLESALVVISLEEHVHPLV